MDNLNHDLHNFKEVTYSDINKLLNSLGYRSCYKGFLYLREFLYQSCKEKELNENNLSSIFRYMESQYSIPKSRAESAMRNIIKNTWKKCGTRPWKDVLNIKLYMEPTIKEVIVTLTEYLLYGKR